MVLITHFILEKPYIIRHGIESIALHLKDYKVPEEYYCTLLHEIVHSTGHQSRIARPGVTTQGVAFGDEVYSKERGISSGNGCGDVVWSGWY
ncbi:zincin-like metallopeptidase domain-containing protein [Bacillus sp. ISL-7]|uniref:zincin-like metallopeptidase domain-containing protein n=1 Tax=Bacillus sp. ISL-7 TaxID=2819136 RepID=UPI0035A86752